MLRQGPSRRSAAARAPAAAVVPGLIGDRHRAATKAARRARRSGEAADFHRTRIRLKRLRYALEFVSEIYDRKTAKYLRHVVKLQDALGLMQDARVAAARLQELATSEGSTLSTTTIFVMGSLTERYRNESERLARTIPDLLHELGGSEWRKLTALMERRRLELGAAYRWPGPPVASPAIPPGAPATSTPAAVVPTPPPRSAPTPVPNETPAPAPVEPLTERPVAGRPVPAGVASSTWSRDPSPPSTPPAPVRQPTPSSAEPGPDEPR